MGRSPYGGCEIPEQLLICETGSMMHLSVRLLGFWQRRECLVSYVDCRRQLDVLHTRFAEALITNDVLEQWPNDRRHRAIIPMFTRRFLFRQS